MHEQCWFDGGGRRASVAALKSERGQGDDAKEGAKQGKDAKPRTRRKASA